MQASAEGGEDMARQWIGDRDRFQQIRRAVTILNIGAVNGKTDQKPNDVSGNVTFAPLDPLASVIASNPAAFGCFHALTVDNARRWACLASFGLTGRSDGLAIQFPQ